MKSCVSFYGRDWQGARDKVLEHYPTVYAFCRAHPDLTRGTVYQVLNGRYPGKIEHQIQKILNALGVSSKTVQPTRSELTQDQTVDMLQTIRCSHCRKLSKRECGTCRSQTEREGRELYTRLFPGR